MRAARNGANKGSPEPATPGSGADDPTRLALSDVQKESALALWYRARTSDSRSGTRKTMNEEQEPEPAIAQQVSRGRFRVLRNSASEDFSANVNRDTGPSRLASHNREVARTYLAGGSHACGDWPGL